MKTILEKIDDNAREHPERIAYRVENPEGGLSAFSSLSWRELNEYSGRLASYLDRHCTTKTPVIVYGHKDPYMIVCFLACVKSGRAYCPVDVSVPLNRVESIVNEVNPEIIFAMEHLPLQNAHILTKESALDVISRETSMISRDKYVSAEEVFYIIFTSGSTGTPKGVQITRDCLDNFIHWAISFVEGAETALTFLNQAPFSFDLSVMDLYLSLYSGGTLWALTKAVQGDMKKLLQTFEKSHANVWVSTPSFADVCLADKKFSEDILPDLQLFLFCGETLTNRTAERLDKAFPNAEIVNTYGPTESTVAVTGVVVTPEIREQQNPLPVGKEKKGTWILIMDENHNLLAEGEKGEIVIAGDSVSIGYWNQPELTKRAFGTYEVDRKTYRLYHTGDRGYKENGLLYYCGRIDFQIKLHGYRIEIEDIESNLMKLESVRKVVVMPVYRDEQVKSLTAYVVPKQSVTDSFAEAQKMRMELKKFLPDYMIPKKIIFLDQLPMTSNGKVDRKALGGNRS